MCAFLIRFVFYLFITLYYKNALALVVWNVYVYRVGVGNKCKTLIYSSIKNNWTWMKFLKGHNLNVYGESLNIKY